MADDEGELLRAVALRNASTILKVRQRAEQEFEQAHDALERKTEELAHSLAMMKATLDSTTDGILVTNEHFQVTGYNEKFLQMWQVPDQALQHQEQRVLLELMAGHFADPGAFKTRVGDICLAAPPASFDLLLTLDGRAIERQSRPQVVQGAVVGRAWSFRDITEQRQAEEALRDETRVLELLNRTGRNLVAQLDLRSVVQAVTDAGTEISGARFGAFFYNVAEKKSAPFVLYTLSGTPGEAFRKFAPATASVLFAPISEGQPSVRSDDVLADPRYAHWAQQQASQAEPMPLRSYLAVPVVSRSGEMIGGLFFGHHRPAIFTERSEKIIVGVAAQAAVAIDNARLYETAQQSAEERKRLLENERSARNLAERMSALKDDFLATLSHELRTPLSAIMGWVHILRRGVKTPEDLQKGLDTIERNSRLQIQLIEDLLDMNRIASGKVRLDIQPVEPLSFIEAAIETVRPAADAKGVRIERLFDPSVGPLPGDPGRLQQVMTNLLGNAVKFTPRGGKVQALLERVNSHVEITVADTGIGINPDFLPHVFERFRQADASSSRQYGGLGLGLSIVKSLVELHGGSVHVQSAGEGLGTSFSVQLPLPAVHAYGTTDDRAHPRAPSPVAPVFPTLDLSGLTVLVVDDDADGGELARRVLSECQANVLVASNAQDALALVQAYKPDVMVSDIGMPEVDGFELLRRIRKLGKERGGRLPAVALTAFARSQDRTQALHAGFVAHLSKPVEPSELLATVASAAGRTA